MKLLLNQEVFTRMLKRIAHEIIENNSNLNEVVLVGIEKKGKPIALELANLIEAFEAVKLPVVSLNINAHRDDEKKNSNHKLDFNYNITGKTVILVDDVLFTGRSVRAAMDALMDVGRPQKISLAVLIDRGHRELPIRADYIGKNIPTSRKETVICNFEEKEIWLND